jgi:hypothetical protein
MGRTVAALILLLSGSLGVATAEDSTEASIGDSRLTAGDVVVLEEPIDGNAFAAGSRVELRERVDRSAFLSGGSVTMAGSVGRNLYAAGGEVRIEGEVERQGPRRAARCRYRREARQRQRRVCRRLDQVDGTVERPAAGVRRHDRHQWPRRGDVELAGRGMSDRPRCADHRTSRVPQRRTSSVDAAAWSLAACPSFSGTSLAARWAHATIFGGVTISFGMVLLGAL